MTALAIIGLGLFAFAIGLVIAYAIRLLDLAGDYLKARTAAIQAECNHLKGSSVHNHLGTTESRKSAP